MRLTAHGIRGVSRFLMGSVAERVVRLVGPLDAAERGRVAGLVALGAVVMLAIAGVLEGIGRQVVTDDFARYGIGIGMLAFWSLYFLGGRHELPAVGSIDD